MKRFSVSLSVPLWRPQGAHLLLGRLCCFSLRSSVSPALSLISPATLFTLSVSSIMLITSTHHFFSLVPQHLFSLPTHNSSSSIYTSTLFQSESPRIPSGSTSGSAADWVQGETAERRDLTGVELARDRTTPVWSEPALLLLSSLLSFFFYFYQASCSVSVCVNLFSLHHSRFFLLLLSRRRPLMLSSPCLLAL